MGRPTCTRDPSGIQHILNQLKHVQEARRDSAKDRKRMQQADKGSSEIGCTQLGARGQQNRRQPKRPTTGPRPSAAAAQKGPLLWRTGECPARPHSGWSQPVWMCPAQRKGQYQLVVVVIVAVPLSLGRDCGRSRVSFSLVGPGGCSCCGSSSCY